MIIFSSSGDAIVNMARSGEARIPPVDPPSALPADFVLDFPAEPKSKFMLFFFFVRLPTSAKTEL